MVRKQIMRLTGRKMIKKLSHELSCKERQGRNRIRFSGAGEFRL